MNGKRWVIIDTETDGLRAPIHIVELSGQLMEGWEQVGKPFRMLLNHNVLIPSEAVAIHGYTQGYLRLFGKPPSDVYSAFRTYAGDCPLVAHNLSYDWDQCLKPEWERLGVPQIGQRGFCSMMLARRLVSETSTYKLEALKKCFQLSPTQGHRAENDVMAVVELFQKVYRQRLEQAGINTFDSIAKFAERTPIAKCFGNRKAAEQGEAQASFNLGNCYHKGEGVAKDMVKAVMRYEKSAEQGDAQALFNLGNCYYNGEGVAKDVVTAALYWEWAAEQGHAGAQINSGNCYYNGEGERKNIVEAYALYYLASVTNEVALENRDKIAKEMTREQIAAAIKRAKLLQEAQDEN
jgi:DNA polymerase III epsilon subunit-like protein